MLAHQCRNIVFHFLEIHASRVRGEGGASVVLVGAAGGAAGLICGYVRFNVVVFLPCVAFSLPPPLTPSIP